MAVRAGSAGVAAQRSPHFHGRSRGAHRPVPAGLHRQGPGRSDRGPPAADRVRLGRRRHDRGFRCHQHDQADRALRRLGRRDRRAPAYPVQRQAQCRGGVGRRRAVHLQVGRQPRDRGLADEALRVRGRQEIPAGALYPRRAPLGLWRELVRRIPEPGRRGDVGSVHQSAGVERIRSTLHLRHPGPLVRRGLPGSHARRGHGLPASGRGLDPDGGDRRRGSPPRPTGSRRRRWTG
jgi:hypothetical protein